MLFNFIDIERLIHSIKTLVACLIGFVLAKIIGFSAGGPWVIVSIIVVMCAQPLVGGVLYKSYLRFLGTLVGSLFAAITLVWFGVNDVSAAITIGISSFIFSYFATGKESLSYAGTLGAATTAIILMYPHPTLKIAVERFFEISLGILIAALTSQFVLPMHARTLLRRTQAQTFGQLRDHYIASMNNPTFNAQLFTYEDLDESIVKSISRQRQLAQESAREPLGMLFDHEVFIQCLYSEKEILRAIDFMHNALLNMPDNLLIIESEVFKTFNQSIIEIFNVLIERMEAGIRPDKHIHLPSLPNLRAGVEKLLDKPSWETLINVNGFLFAAESLARGLEKLARIYSIPIYDSAEKLA